MKKAFDHLSRHQRAELKARVLASIEATTDEEDAAIHAAAMSDPDNPPLSLVRGRRPSPEREAQLRANFAEAVAKARAGRPPKAVTKQPVTLRLDRDIVEKFRATGDGWQTRMNDALRKAAARL